MTPPSEPVAWDVAERVAGGVARRTDTRIDWATLRSLVVDFEEVTAQAEALVEESTGLRSLVGPARAQVATREEWIHANISSFRRLLGPVLARAGKSGQGLPGLLGPVGRAAAGAEMGVVLGWMSGRVLGQYDLLFADGDSPQDAVYYVGPNIVSLERRHGFEPREFRLWIALHELTHRAQFTGVPWLRGHFLDLVERSVAIASPDPRQVMEAIGRMAVEIVSGRNPLAESGLVGALASPAQLETLRSIQGMMSLLEGHGDVTMDRAARDLIPSAAHFSQVLHARRESAGGLAKLFQQLIGLEAKLRQYGDGARFVREVEEVGGPQLLALAWQGPENLPSAAEVQAPDLWVSRVRGPALEPA
ncbi:MAG: zinc-dependent metalloprotease [Acidimicrobiales bacterium]